jgi:predicted nucleic acid-binding Zn ribbon protein
MFDNKSIQPNQGDEPLSDALARRIVDRGFGRQLEATNICQTAQNVLGRDVAVVSFAKGVLKIKVASDSSAYILKMQEAEICQKVNDALGQEKVKSLRFLIDKN